MERGSITSVEKQRPVLIDLPYEAIKKLDDMASQIGKSREEKAREIVMLYIDGYEENREHILE